jgi:hypothetical protein
LNAGSIVALEPRAILAILLVVNESKMLRVDASRFVADVVH